MPNDDNSQNNNSTPLGLDPIQKMSSPLPNQPVKTPTNPASLEPSPVINNIGEPNITPTNTPPSAPPPTLGLDVAPPPMESVLTPTPQTPSGGDKKDKKPKSKGKNKKAIASILGILVLVGGMAVGTTLVKQQQDIREKAASLKGPTGICTSDGCDVGSKYGTDCWVSHWGCARIDNLGGGCQDKKIASGVQKATFKKSCGTEQIDVYCPGESLDGNFVSRINNSPCYQKVCNGKRCEKEIGLGNNQCTTDTDCGARTPTPSPTSTPTSPPNAHAQCVDIRIFDTNWKRLSADDLTKLKSGDKIRLTVAGSTNSGSINRARFTVNGKTRPAVTQKKPNTERFFDEYTVPEAATGFRVKAELKHSTFGWF